MGARIYEEAAVVIRQKHTVRLLEYKENGSEFTEINVYSKELTEKDELSNHFTFGFTVKGRGDEEKEKIEKMNEREFEQFIKHMTYFLERKYHVAHKKEVKKEYKEEEKKEDEQEDEKKDEKPAVDGVDTFEDIDDFEVPTES
jgi:uncharacterized Fe-S cluster-containing radical SAM superfamily protein